MKSGGGRSGWLGYDVVDSECPLYRQRRALRSAILMSNVLHRSLLLPRFCSQADGGRSVAFSFLFDYSAFASAFPDHAEAALSPSSYSATASASSAATSFASARLTRVHVSLADAPAHKPPSGALPLDASFKARSPKGVTESEVASRGAPPGTSCTLCSLHPAVAALCLPPPSAPCGCRSDSSPDRATA